MVPGKHVGAASGLRGLPHEVAEFVHLRGHLLVIVDASRGGVAWDRAGCEQRKPFAILQRAADRRFETAAAKLCPRAVKLVGSGFSGG